jgi:nitrite reductase/ring-hydroxylating ferredoxin subunit
MREAQKCGADAAACPWHGSHFDLCSREASWGPPETPAACRHPDAGSGAIDTQGVLDQVDGRVVATVTLVLAARTAAERVAVS